jgi:hypothetical protein
LQVKDTGVATALHLNNTISRETEVVVAVAIATCQQPPQSWAGSLCGI